MAADSFVPNDGTVTWRYMKLNSFLELLSGHLVQTRIDMLHDAAEGAYGFKKIRFAPSLLSRLGFNGATPATYWYEFEERESSGMWSVDGALLP